MMNDMIVDNETLSLCYHCGEACTEKIVSEEKNFCCEGCKTVYHILNESNLCNYYDLNTTPGINLNIKSLNEYSFLDHGDIQDKVIDFKEEGMTSVRFFLPQIHCSSCIWLLENLYLLKEGILVTKVNFHKKEIRISFDDRKISLKEVAELLASLGYKPLINLEKLDDEPEKKQDKSIYYKLGLAGFTFGNIMLLSFPEYLGLDKYNDEDIGSFFSYLNIILILPVVLYSGKDYLSSAWIGLKKKHLNVDVPISLGIITLLFRSLYEIMSHTGAGYLDSLAGLIFFLLIGKWFQQKTYANLSFDRDYKSYFPISTTLLSGNKETPVPVNQLKKSDRIIVRNGELIPVDAILRKGLGIIDYSFVSGESKNVKKEESEKIYAGGRQMGAAIELEVEKKIEQSYLTQLWNNDIFNKKDNQSTYHSFTDGIAKHFTWIILGIALFTFLYWFPKNASMAFNAVTAVLIIACPCALALAAPFVFGNVIRILGRENFYLKNTIIVEKLSQINHIVFDKTGTITTTSNNEINADEIHVTEKEKEYIKSLCYHSSHPVSKNICNLLSNKKLLEIDSFEEIIGKGVVGILDGYYVRVGSASFIGAEDEQGVYVEIDGKIKGRFLQSINFRNDIKNIFDEFKMNYEMSMLTGDNNNSREELIDLFNSADNLRFNQSPDDKLKYIESLQEKGNQVMMVGDGLNDAGALKQSDVGLVITEDINNFTPASDVIIDAREILKLPKFISFSQKSTHLLYVAYFISFLYNIIGLYFAVQGELSPVIAAILMPLSSITTILFGVISTAILSRIILD